LTRRKNKIKSTKKEETIRGLRAPKPRGLGGTLEASKNATEAQIEPIKKH
jgi:hypothetical protein